MNPGDQALEAIEVLLERGQFDQALAQLRDHNQGRLVSIRSLHRQAILEQKYGDQTQAGRLHYQVLQHAPNVALGYLHAGKWLLEHHHEQAAAAAFSVVLDLDPELLKGDSEAVRLTRTTLTELHQLACLDLPDESPVKLAIWPRTHSTQFEYDDEAYKPALFYVPKITRQPHWESNLFTWADTLTASTPKIKHELEAVLGAAQSEAELRPYLHPHMQNLGELQSHAGRLSWSAIDLFKAGERNERVAHHFQHTLSALEQIPTYGLGDSPFEVFFSVLQPQQSIAHHFGESNHALTVHLPLIVPGEGWLEVANERYPWAEGQPLIFDDSFQHAAYNHSNAARIVLIFSIWHPDLSALERTAVQSSFQAREAWYAQRGQVLQAALET